MLYFEINYIIVLMILYEAFLKPVYLLHLEIQAKIPMLLYEVYNNFMNSVAFILKLIL